MDDKTKNRRLITAYNITLEQYRFFLARQAGGCAICKSTPKTRGLHVDHDHKYKQVEIQTRKDPDAGGWETETEYLGTTVRSEGSTKVRAIQRLHQNLKHLSVRGLLCYNCNMGLRRFRDNPTFLRAAVIYLEKHQGVRYVN